MKQYFEIKAKFEKVDENGKTKKVTEQYLIDAVSFTDGEARITKELEQMISGEFTIKNMSRSNISEVFQNPNGDRWFKAKVSTIDIDPDSGKEKKANNYMLVEANTVEDAYQFLEEQLSTMLVPYEIPSVSESPIMEVFEYDLEEGISGGLKLSCRGNVLVDQSCHHNGIGENAGSGDNSESCGMDCGSNENGQIYAHDSECQCHDESE